MTLSVTKTAVLAWAFFAPAITLAQYPAGIEERLQQIAADRPDVAQALEFLAASRDAGAYTEQEFRDNVSIQTLQYHLSADGKAILGTGMRGSGSIGATVGGAVMWTDGDTGQTQNLFYNVRSRYDAEKGIVVFVTIRPPGEDAIIKEHVVRGLDSVSVVLHEMADGSKYIVRATPTLERKEQVVDFVDRLPIRLRSAILIADDAYAGTFSASGSIVGITSSRAGMRFEFGLKPFADAKPIGKTDGHAIWFDHDGVSYSLRNSGPLTATTRDGLYWTVYVRAEQRGAFGDGTRSKSYHAQLIQEVLESLEK
jgi:hypothetical protein